MVPPSPPFNEPKLVTPIRRGEDLEIVAPLLLLREALKMSQATDICGFRTRERQSRRWTGCEDTYMTKTRIQGFHPDMNGDAGHLGDQKWMPSPREYIRSRSCSLSPPQLAMIVCKRGSSLAMHGHVEPQLCSACAARGGEADSQ